MQVISTSQPRKPMTWKFGCLHLANTVKSPAAQIVVIFKRGVVRDSL